jgi:epoxyqueuosine reductase QueG
MDTSTIKATEQMEDAKSIIVFGYHASDDIYEVVLRKVNGIESYYALLLRNAQRRLILYLHAKGLRAEAASQKLPRKQMARLAGFGNYGKNALLVTPKYGPWIRLGAIVTNAEFVYDEPFDRDLCGECDRCIKACPTGALTPYKVDHTRCLVNPYDDDDWAGLISGELKYSEKFGKTPDVDAIYSRHNPRLTDNSILMCTTCQRACPYGAKERGLEK